MSATMQNPFRKSVRKVFDAASQAQVIAFTKLGSSRRLAAQKAGFHHTTIGRKARRDAAFARQLDEAENHVDVASLTRINEAAAENKNWRAAAWILERRHPNEFGRRAANSFSADQVMALLAEVFAFTMPVVPRENANDFLWAFNRAMGRVEGNAKNADRWQKLAGVNVTRRPDGEPLRSPYEHPQWCDPDRPTTAKEESDEAITWVNDLPKDDLERVREIYYRDRAERKERASETMKDRLLRLLAEEKAAEAAAKEKVDEAAADPVAAAEPVGPPVTVNERPLAADASSSAAPEQKCQVAAASAVAIQEDAVPEAATSAAIASTEPHAESVEPVPPAVLSANRQELLPPPGVRPPCEDYIPPTPEEHQSYQAWLQTMEPLVRRKLLLAMALQQQAPIAPYATNTRGGASETRL